MRSDLVLSNDKKIIFLILDGVGDIPTLQLSYGRPLEADKKPNIDGLAIESGILGRMIPVDIGVTPGSGPGHLSLFGYDPLEYEIGRGVLEVLRLNTDLQDGDFACEDDNFAEKIAATQNVDPLVPDICSLNPHGLVITGVHSTPCPMKGRSWHPVPVRLATKTGEMEGTAFHERNWLAGSMGTIYSKQLMPLVLAHGLKFDKYGA
jgi:2,3-bisphosphoglycerate-independent phosphoglycerate mutase